MTGKSIDEITAVLKDLTLHGFTLPRSPESDVIVANPIIDGKTDEYTYEGLNLTQRDDDGTPRQNPMFNGLEYEATTMN